MNDSSSVEIIPTFYEVERVKKKVTYSQVRSIPCGTTFFSGWFPTERFLPMQWSAKPGSGYCRLSPQSPFLQRLPARNIMQYSGPSGRLRTLNPLPRFLNLLFYPFPVPLKHVTTRLDHISWISNSSYASLYIRRYMFIQFPGCIITGLGLHADIKLQCTKHSACYPLSA